jgi:iron complex transport system substrate-binding protein
VIASKRSRVALPVFGPVLCLLIAGLAGASEANAGDKHGKRVVALSPFSANTLVHVGVKPVAIGESAGGNPRLSRRLRNVPRIPLSHASNGPNLEQLVSYDPDIVFSEDTWNAGRKSIERLGIQVVVQDPDIVRQVPKAIKRVGKTVKRKGNARKVAKRTKKAIKKATKGIESRPRVLMILGVGQTPYAFLPNSWGGNVVKRAGGRLLTNGLTNDGDDDLLVSGGFAQLSDEEILSRNPDVIIAVPHGNRKDIGEITESLRNDETFRATNAGANNRIYATLDNTLLQPSTGVAKTIRRVRREFLLNR